MMERGQSTGILLLFDRKTKVRCSMTQQGDYN
jgi:hypothetical protein